MSKSSSNLEYELKNSLPNKLMQDDGTITDITGKPVDKSVQEYDHKPSLPNKFMNPDGTYSTLNEIIAGMVDPTIFIIVDELPESGEENKIYLVPNEDGYFDEYHYTSSKWDKVGELKVDMTNYSTTEQVQVMIATALQEAKEYAERLIREYVPMQSFDNYPTINSTGTTAEFFTSIQDLDLPVGTLLLGKAELTDLDDVAPSMKNEEIRVEIYPNDVIHAVMTSTDVEPYEWHIQFWHGTESWSKATTLDVVENLIDEKVTNVLGGEY